MKKIYTNLLLSYLAIMILLIGTEAIVSYGMIKTSRTQAEKLNENMISMVREECDNHFSEIIKYLDILSLNEDVAYLSGTRKSFGNSEQYRAYSLQTDVKQYNYLANDYDQIFIYFYDSDKVVSSKGGNMSFSLFYDIYYKDYEIGKEELRQYLEKSHYHDVILLDSRKENAGLLYSTTNVKNSIGNCNATIAIVESVKNVEKRLVSAEWSDKTSVYAIGSNGIIMGRSNCEYTDPEEVTKENKDDNVYYVYDEDERRSGLGTGSQVIDAEYIMLTSDSVTEANTLKAIIICVSGLVACVLGGVFISIYLANKNYNPIKDIIRENGKSKEQLKELYLSKLITRPFSELKPNELSALHEMGYVDGKVFRVIIFILDEEDRTDPLKAFILKNVLSENLNNVYKTELLEINYYVAAIVNLNENNTDNYDKMWDAIGLSYDVINKNFGFKIKTCAGVARESIDEIHNSYREAQDALVYSPVIDTYFVNYNDIREKTQKYLEAGKKSESLVANVYKEADEVKEGSNDKFVDDIRKYIAEHFTDPDLNISQLAQAFDMTPSYISQIYKKSTDQSLLKNINQMRIDYSLKLLDEGKTVNETAVLAGFRETRTFIRVFKEHTGFTPGKIKGN